jgi:hypothetical protein
MKIVQTVSRECCQQQDLKVVDGCKMMNSSRYPELKFCVHCGARHKYTSFMDAAGSSDWEYRKVELKAEKAGDKN